MKEEKLQTITNLFEGKEIRYIWDSKKEEYYFSVVDVITALTNSPRPRKYWNALKIKLREEGSEVSQYVGQLKMTARDGKLRETDVLDTKGIFRLIESVPSPKAEPFKMWLAQLGKERIDEVFDPELAIDRAIKYYQNKGYSNEWIEVRLSNILNRKKLTSVWKENGINKEYEYALLTDKIYETWSSMTAAEYKKFKGLTKESLRDNMTDIEVVLSDLGEITTRDITMKERPQGLEKNMRVAKRGGNVAKIAKEYYEKEIGHKAISNKRVSDNKRIGLK